MQVEITPYWNGLLDAFPEYAQDVYFTEEYVKLYEDGDNRAVCFVCKDGEKTMLFPFLSRSFEYQGAAYRDFETAYGYGGPVCNCNDEAFLGAALRAFKEFCQANGYVAGFVRFHPLLQNQVGFDCIGRVLAERKTVAIDLASPMDEVWLNEIHSKNRNMIRKAEKAGCRFHVDDRFEHLQEFVNLYDTTMDRLSAEGFYYFDTTYYHKLVEGVRNTFLGYVTNGEGRIISAAIFMYRGQYGHYHLSGSDRAEKDLSPNNFMLWNAACEMQLRGVKRFHLGGGTNSDEENSLFKFKKRFSKGTCQFYIGKLVFNERVYEGLCRGWERNNPDKAEQYRHHLLRYKY